MECAPVFAGIRGSLDKIRPQVYKLSRPASLSKLNGNALRFGASEYERLATLTEAGDIRNRLQEKAGKLLLIAESKADINGEPLSCCSSFTD